jgi:hypothetical protein
MSIESALKEFILQVVAEAGAEPASTKRGRGRPAKGEEPIAAPAPSPSVDSEPVAEEDPFGAPVAPPPVTVTLEQVREKAVALSKATSQSNAVEVLKTATGAASFGELKPDAYGKAVEAFTVALTALEATADPFAVAGSAPAAKTAPSASAPATVVTDSPSLADVKAAVVAGQKKTSTETVQKIVIDAGGFAVDPATGMKGPSLKQLPVSAYAGVIAAIAKLPATK